ncbi:MAG: response regulator [Patescibacteria group bacterium]|mgnify:CR=1 FL=1
MKNYVLIIEDDLLAQKAYQMKFAKAGVEIKSVSDGNEAVKFIGENNEPPAVALLDLMLPFVSGFEILETMRKNKKWQNVPVIILSNLSQEADMERAKNLGVKDYLIKADTRIDDVIAKALKYIK